MTTRDIQSTVATSQHTVNYDLPLWNGTDITSWQGNLNDAFNKIDTAMFENQTAMLGYKEIADKLADTNDTSIEKVEEVNEQLAEINANYEQVKQGLVDANKLITEANQAILALQQEDESVKVQMDTMQDDIGKLMEWEMGIEYAPSTPIQLTPTVGSGSGSLKSVTRISGIIWATVLNVKFGNGESYLQLEMSEADTALMVQALELEDVLTTLPFNIETGDASIRLSYTKSGKKLIFRITKIDGNPVTQYFSAGSIYITR